MNRSETSARRERLLDFLAQDPGNTQLLAEIIDLDLALGLLGDAEERLKRGLELAPDDTQLLFQKAGLALRSGAVDEAERLLQNIFHDRGIDAPGIRYSLAYTRMLKSLHGEAKLLLSPIAGNPETPDATSLLVRCLHFLGELEEAIALAEKHMRDHPGDATMMGSLSLLYTDMDDMGKADEWAKRALAIEPDNVDGLLTQGTLNLGQEDTEKAIERFQRVLAHKPTSGRAWVGLGLSEMLNLDLETAKGHLAKATEHLPTHIGTWHAMAWNQIVTSDIPGAKASFLKALELDRNFAETQGGLAVISVLENRHHDAEQEIKIALKLDPQCFSALFAKTLLLSRAGHGKIATKMIESVLTTTAVPGGGTLADMLKRVVNKQTRH